MDGLVRGVGEFVFGQVLFREIAEGTVRIFRGVAILPRSVTLVVLLEEHGLELVFA